MSNLSKTAGNRNMLIGRISGIANNLITILSDTENPLTETEKRLIDKAKNHLLIVYEMRERSWSDLKKARKL